MDQSNVLPNPISALKYLKIAGDLKRTPRTGWIYRGVKEFSRVESVSDHSWRMAAAAFLFSDDPTYNVGKMIQMAVLHDIAEAIIGDIAPADNINKIEKKKREEIATEEIMNELAGFSILGAKNANILINEYEARETNESIAVKDLDMLEMIIQANEYEIETGLDLSDFFQSTAGKFKTKQVISIVEELINQRDVRRVSLKRDDVKKECSQSASAIN